MVTSFPCMFALELGAGTRACSNVSESTRRSSARNNRSWRSIRRCNRWVAKVTSRSLNAHLQQAIAQAAAVVAQAQHQAARAAHSVAPPVAMGGTSMSDGAGGGQPQNHLLPSIAHALPVRLDPQPSESSETG